MKYLIVLYALLLAGCATCREHPATCTVLTAIAAGEVAAIIEVRRSDYRAHASTDCISPYRGGTLKPGCTS